MTNTKITILSNKGDVAVTTKPVGGKRPSLFAAARVDGLQIWTSDFPVGTADEVIEAECRAYLTDNTSILDGVE